QIIAITCDNASANTAMVDELETLIPTFLGRKAHIRCFTHTTSGTLKSCRLRGDYRPNTLP
ncbi:hypothetical protein F5878DRAFT_547126, partial [Lentinula raphanica]